jgi:hypothetical protein
MRAQTVEGFDRTALLKTLQHAIHCSTPPTADRLDTVIDLGLPHRTSAVLGLDVT